jgi:hypothetical protein
MGRGRPGGNPELREHKFTTDRPEPMTAKLSMRIAPSMLAEVQAQENWQEFVREAIAEALRKRHHASES